VAIAALVLGLPALAVVFAAPAALGAAQTARAWRLAGERPQVLVAAACAALLPLSVTFGSWGLGAGVLVATAVSVTAAPGPGSQVVAVAAATIRSWLLVGLAAASVVALARIDLGAAVALVLLVSAFDCGDYLVGVDARWPAVGTMAGIAAVAVVTFALFVVVMPPFGGAPVAVFGAAVALLAPLGQVAGSAVLPDGRALASGLRRLDSYLLTGPAWLVLLAVVPLD
jgi:hypothetical protein